MNFDLKKFTFPVCQRQIAIDNNANCTVEWDNDSSFLSTTHKAIVREDTNEVISVVKDSYKIIPNTLLINELLHFLASSPHRFHIDPSHSYVENSSMRLQVTFPELTLQDSESDINLSLFIENSYDTSSSVKLYCGGLRLVCTNGMIFGQILSKFYAKHTKGFDIADFSASLEEAQQHFPDIQNRIHQLEALPANEGLVEEIGDKISKRLAEQVQEEMNQQRISQWALLNRVTNYISHEIKKPIQARHQQSVSRIFNL